MPEMGVTIISDGLGKPFSVCPAADDDFVLIRVSQFCLAYFRRVDILSHHQLKKH